MKKNPSSAGKEKNLPSSNRRDFIKKASIGGLGAGLLGATAYARDTNSPVEFMAKPLQKAKIKITDIKVAVMGDSPVVRIATDAGINGYGQVESPNHISNLYPFL